MIPAPQPNLIDNLMNGYSCIFYPMCHIARELSYCPKKVGKRDCEDYRSRPTPSPQNDYRDLFVSDLISLIEWDAKHGNPELFKAIHTLKKHYNNFTVEQHNATIRNQTLDEIIKPATDENKKDGWTLNVKWLVKIRDELPREGQTICLEDIEFVLIALNEILRTKEQP